MIPTFLPRSTFIAKIPLALTLALTCALTPWGWCQAQPKAEIRMPAAVDVAKARAEGAILVSNLLSQAPYRDNVTRGVMTIRNGSGQSQQVAFTHRIKIGSNGWESIYEAPSTGGMTFTVVQGLGRTNQYTLVRQGDPAASQAQSLDSNQTMVPFAGSDFWLADLGLEFLHWPDQRVINSEMRRGQSCKVLESINPVPHPQAYSRVVSWVDLDSGGIVHADAFDHRNQLLKQFDPKEFKKINGQWQLSEMEIRNRKTNSRTRIQFELAPEK